MNHLKKFNVPIPQFHVSKSALETEQQLKKCPFSPVVVKAQVLAGGRGKGTFHNGFQGGVHIVKTPSEAAAITSKMIGNRLITKQTGAEGKPCNIVMLAECVDTAKEQQLAILMDRGKGGPVLIASSEGGMNIEEVAHNTPDKISNLFLGFTLDNKTNELTNLFTRIGMTSEQTRQAVSVTHQLFECFMQSDCTQIEVNPLIITKANQVLVCDAKLNFDDNAEFRQKELFDQRDFTQEDPRDVEAKKLEVNYIGLEGSIGCLVNGAGLAMATMDIIKLQGGTPANFLDVGGSADVKQMSFSLKLVCSDPKVKAIFINIFGGILRCDKLAEGVIEAMRIVEIKQKIVIRLKGTNVEQAKEILHKANLPNLIFEEDMDKAAELVTSLAKN